MAWERAEFTAKLSRIRSLMLAEGLGGILLQTQAGFMWLTGGRPFINQFTESACAALLVTTDQVFLVANNIEAERLLTEELAGLPLEPLVYPWWDPAGADRLLREAAGGAAVRTDVELGNRLARLRLQLLPEEMARFTRVGELTASALEAVAFAVLPGQSEADVAALLRQQAAVLGLDPAVVLVAADDRAYRYRHPLPTARAVAQYVLISICARQSGLVASASRLVHFGTAPRELRRRHEAVTRVDVALIGSTAPGRSVADIFAEGMAAYAEQGFPNEWHNHHQGGAAGYLPREVRAAPDSTDLVAEGQVFAWNPTIAGVKSEDTILVEGGGARILTVSPRFPTRLVEYRGWAFQRPDILER